MTRGPGSAIYNETAFPMAWSIARAYRRGELTKPLEWFAATRLPGDVQVLAEVVEMYLANDRGLASLTSWVMEDLPAGEAHFIDSDTDCAWAFLLLWAIRQAARDEDVEGVRVGPNMYANREQFRGALNEIKERGIEIAEDLSLGQASSRVLPSLGVALERAFKEYERSEYERLVESPIDLHLVKRLESALLGRWRSGFPRQLLEQVGSMEVVNDVGPSTARFGLTATASKVFFIEGEGVVGDSPERIGETLADSILRGESQRLENELLRVGPTQVRGTLRERLLRAMRSMERAGGTPTHGLVPRLWAVPDPLLEAGAEQTRFEWGKREWTFEGLTLLEWSSWSDESIALLRLPEAIRTYQYLNNRLPSITIELEMLNINPETDTREIRTDPAVRIAAFERWRLRLYRRHVRRVPLPIRTPD